MKIEVIEKELGNILVIEHTSTMLKMPLLMKEGFLKILDYIKSNGIKEPKEAPFACYVNVDWDKELNSSVLKNFINVFRKKWYYSIGFLVDKKIEGSNEIVSKKVNNRKYISCIHYGPYQAVGKTYRKMVEYSRNNNLDIEDMSYEFYLNDPTKVGKSNLETRCLIPVK